MRLGISSWTYAWSVGVAGFPAPSAPLDAFGLLAKARELGVGVLQIADNLPLERLSTNELGALAARGLLDYFFNYYMWGYRQVWRVLALEILPVVAYSTLLAPLPYLLCRWVYGRFRQRLED